VSASGKLSDGTPITLASGVSDNLDVRPLRSVLYGGKGGLQGTTPAITSSPLAVWPPIYLLGGAPHRKKLSQRERRRLWLQHDWPQPHRQRTIPYAACVRPHLLGQQRHRASNAEIEFTGANINPAANAEHQSFPTHR